MSPSVLRFAVSAAILTLSSGAFAQASDPCGGIEFESISDCRFEFDGGCEAKCEPIAFSAACNARCDLDINAACSSNCGASCVAACEADPPRFDCRASCTADCQADASARCGTDSECVAYFEGECSASCESECAAVPPEADCEAQCQGCCGGSCTVEANFDCELGCTADLQGGCEIDCREPSGALFCDGKYLPVVDLPACIDYLLTNYEVQVDVEASAEASLSCSAVQPGVFTDGSAIYGGLLGLGLVFARRRRRSAS
ncbi:MAG: hypothetical protein AAF928_06450 [Myxococcota bacterium]